MTCRVMITLILKIQMKHVLLKCSSSGLRLLDKPISCSCSAILPLRLCSTLLLLFLHPLPLYPYLVDSLTPILRFQTYTDFFFIFSKVFLLLFYRGVTCEW